MTTTTITAGDTVNPMQITAGNDGTFSIKVGPSGAKVTAISIAANGTITYSGTVSYTLVPSTIRLSGSNGMGTTNTKVLRWTTVITNTGTDITYTDSATLGGYFTINNSGVYLFSSTFNFNAAETYYLTANDVALSSTTPIPNQVLAISSRDSTSGLATISWAGYLPAGTVVYFRSSSGSLSSSSTSYNIFANAARIA